MIIMDAFHKIPDEVITNIINRGCEVGVSHWLMSDASIDFNGLYPRPRLKTFAYQATKISRRWRDIIHSSSNRNFWILSIIFPNMPDPQADIAKELADAKNRLRLSQGSDIDVFVNYVFPVQPGQDILDHFVMHFILLLSQYHRQWRVISLRTANSRVMMFYFGAIMNIGPTPSLVDLSIFGFRLLDISSDSLDVNDNPMGRLDALLEIGDSIACFCPTISCLRDLDKLSLCHIDFKSIICAPYGLSSLRLAAMLDISVVEFLANVPTLAELCLENGVINTTEASNTTGAFDSTAASNRILPRLHTLQFVDHSVSLAWTFLRLLHGELLQWLNCTRQNSVVKSTLDDSQRQNQVSFPALRELYMEGSVPDADLQFCSLALPRFTNLEWLTITTNVDPALGAASNTWMPEAFAAPSAVKFCTSSNEAMSELLSYFTFHATTYLSLQSEHTGSFSAVKHLLFLKLEELEFQEMDTQLAAQFLRSFETTSLLTNLNFTGGQQDDYSPFIEIADFDYFWTEHQVQLSHVDYVNLSLRGKSGSLDAKKLSWLFRIAEADLELENLDTLHGLQRSLESVLGNTGSNQQAEDSVVKWENIDFFIQDPNCVNSDVTPILDRFVTTLSQHGIAMKWERAVWKEDEVQDEIQRCFRLERITADAEQSESLPPQPNS